MLFCHWTLYKKIHSIDYIIDSIYLQSRIKYISFKIEPNNLDCCLPVKSQLGKIVKLFNFHPAVIATLQLLAADQSGLSRLIVENMWTESFL